MPYLVASDVPDLLQQLQGPTVLVGHSYGGAVITNAGAGQPNVIGLVYASAFAPDLGEVLGQFPLGPGTVNLYPVTYPNNFGTFLFLNQQKFRESFAQDVDALQASIMATVQKPGNVAHFTDPTTAVAWKTLPSWYLISTNDRMIPPSLRCGHVRSREHGIHLRFLEVRDQWLRGFLERNRSHLSAPLDQLWCVQANEPGQGVDRGQPLIPRGDSASPLLLQFTQELTHTVGRQVGHSQALNRFADVLSDIREQ